MKKIILIFLVSFVFLFLFSGITYAIDPLVPCGQGSSTIQGTDPKGNPTQVPNPDFHRCELADVFKLIENVYNFVVLYISTPLAGLGVVIGGVLILISGGPGGANPITGIASPNLYSRGKSIVTGSIFGWLLIWCAWLIINSVLIAIGLPGL